MKKLNRRSLLLFLPAVLVFLDQLTKVWARDVLKNRGEIIVIPDVLEFRYLENRGAAWGMLQGRLNILTVVTVILLILFLWLLFRVPEGKRYLPVYLVFLFIISGAIGNLIDRIWFDYVTDFIYFSLINFPIFNVADIYVTCSVFVLVILVLLYYSDEELSFLPLFGSKKSKDNPDESPS
ncbi:MAG: signal peptidase II [Lachnospiraceae bacterium]|nr:signal peptidase II [Lachnospiraceae bacterium]